jgi:thiol-disulfide isomerase/thioredoxin
MKNITVLIFFLMWFSGCKTTKPIPASEKTDHPAPAVDYSEQSTWLLGYFSQNKLTYEPHATWYYKGFDEYVPDAEAMEALQGIDKNGLSIRIVVGTWCPDSRREVPRFMKVLEIWRFPPENVTFIGVDDLKNSPIGDYDDLDIQRVPTFIIYKNNIEAGRIIENPMTSLEQDMVIILEMYNKTK